MKAQAELEDPQLRHWLLPLALAVIGAIGWACSDPGDKFADSGDASADDGADDAATGSEADDGPGDPTVEPGDVLESIALNVIVPTTAQFATLATELAAASDAYAVAVDTNPVDAGVELAAAQVAWAAAMTSLQHLEVMQIGPAAPSVSAIAGENLRDELYSWPTSDTCTVDRGIVDGDYDSADFFANNNVFAYGIDALEYLLFVHDQNHTCPTQVQLDGPWTGLGFDEIERRRGAYAASVAAEIARQAGVLATRWSPDGDDFAAQLADPISDSPFESDAVALDDVFRAMFYVDLRTKDDKLGRALGLVDGCAAAPCPDLLESPFGSLSAGAITANLDALKLMVHGGPDPATHAGFDDLLAGVGQSAVAAQLVSEIDAALAEAQGMDQPMQQLIVTDVARVEALHAAVKAVTDTLKGPFVMALMLTIPMEGAGDAD